MLVLNYEKLYQFIVQSSKKKEYYKRLSLGLTKLLSNAIVCSSSSFICDKKDWIVSLSVKLEKDNSKNIENLFVAVTFYAITFIFYEEKYNKTKKYCIRNIVHL